MVVLIACATSRGSTRGVADRIADRLRQHGIAVEVRPMTDAVDVDVYEAVVLGSAVHGGKWLPEAHQFADRQTVILRHKPTWLFSVSTIGDQESMFAARVARRFRIMRRTTPEIAALQDAIHARGHRNFAGSIARADWPLRGRIFFRAMGGSYGDHRNWPAIDDWADTIAAGVAVQVAAHTVRRPE